MLTAINRSLENKRARLENNEKGFTLIELLVVVIIIGILAAVAIPIFLGQQATARDSSVESAITSAKTAVVAHITEGNALSTVNNDLTNIAAYTPSKNIKVTIAIAGNSFTITGDWVDDSGTVVAGHQHTITDKGAAEKVASP